MKIRPARSILGGVGLFCLAGCGVDLGVADGALISCATDQQCPQGYRCQPTTERCVPHGMENIEPPRPKVAFLVPDQGETNVGLSPTIIVAFTMDVVSASVTSHTALQMPDKTSVTIEPLDAAAATATLLNVYRFVPQSVLARGVTYTIRIDAGVEPLADGALPSGEVFTSSFTTIPPVSPVDAISNLVISRESDTQILLSWDLPTVNPVSTVLIVRSMDAAATGATPTDAVVYKVGNPLGNTTVVTQSVDRTWLDTDVLAGHTYDYVLFGVGSENNYAPARRAPFLEKYSLTWCSDESATVTLASPTALGQAVWVSTNPAERPDGSSAFPSGPAAPHDAPLVVPVGSVLSPGVVNYIRPVVSSPDGTYVDQTHAVLLDSARLAIVQQPGSVSPGGVASFAVELGPWPDVEMEVDADPTAGAETYVGATTTSPGTGVRRATQSFAQTGGYLFRARATKPGCAPGPWTLSDPLAVGSFLYVVAGGTGAQSGQDPQNALATINAALALAYGDWEIYVSAGDYGEALDLGAQASGVHLLGSFSPDFSTRSLLAPNSVVHAASGPTLHVSAGAHQGTLIEGFRIESGAGGTQNAVLVTSGSPELRANYIVEPDSANTAITRVVAITYSAVDVVLDGNHISGGIHRDIDDLAVLDVRSQGSAIVRSNTIWGGTGQKPQAVAVIYDGEAVLTGNLIDGGVADGTPYSESFGLTVAFGAAATVTNNVIRGGQGGAGSHALVVHTAAQIIFVNNTLNGDGLDPDVVLVKEPPLWAANNIIYVTHGSAGATCMWGYLADNTGVSLFNNVFAGCSTGVFRFPQASPWTTFATNCFDGAKPGALGDAACATTLAGSGNLVLDQPQFLGLVSTFDWHLTSGTPTAVQKSGLDKASCDAVLAGDCGDITHDRDNVLRTCVTAGTDCYSLGAYELDAP